MIFQGCTYLLYPAHMEIHPEGDHQILHTDPEDLKVAKRRVECAICALGGYLKDPQVREQSTNTSPSSATNDLSKSSRSLSKSASVFRRMDYQNYGYGNNSAPFLSSSSTSSSDYYRDRFHQRYFIGDHGISWEVEENPPVFVSVDEEDSVVCSVARPRRVSATTLVGTSNGGARKGVLLKKEDGRQLSPQPYGSDSNPSSSLGSSTTTTQVDHTQKMKYRCKLCGQPKQNHVCPYRKSLLRTIGIMVCPAVNAYTSAEPGVLTQALSEMNNFVPYGRGSVIGSFCEEITDLDADGSSRDHSSTFRLTPGGSKQQKARDRRHHHSPAASSLSTSPHSSGHRSLGENTFAAAATSNSTHAGHRKQVQGHHRPQQQANNLWHRKPRLDHSPLFMTLGLRPEHYRAVTPRTPHRNSSGLKTEERDDKEEDSFQYPHVPLTFLGRKRLTDTLFYLSQSIPSVTTDVASLLRMARANEEWDLAVAEVLTQVVVCIHCAEGDFRLNGLKNYLLKIGIAS